MTTVPTTAAATDGRNLLTNSSEQAFLTCPRMFFWSYEKGWRPDRGKAPLRIGSAGHLGVDLLAKGQTIERALEAIRDAYEIHIQDAEAWVDAESAKHDLRLECVTVECLVQGYARAWAGSQIEILESEKVFDLPIINPDTGAPSRTFRQAGRRDRIARLPDGRTVLLETKFITDDLAPDGDYWRILGLNQQLSKYVLAARAEGLDVQSAIYDVIRKPSIKPCDQPEIDEHGLVVVRDASGERVRKKNNEWRLTADAEKGFTIRKRPMTAEEWRAKLTSDIASQPERYYARQEVPRLDSDLEEYSHELWWIADSIRQARNANRWFRNSGSCRKFNSLCPYYPLCAGEVDCSGGVPAGFRQAENVHQELTTPDEEEGVL